MKSNVLRTEYVHLRNGYLKNVLLVKGLGANFTSIYKFVQDSYEFVASTDQVINREIKHLNSIGTIDHDAGLFKLTSFVGDGSIPSGAPLISHTYYMSKLWHD